MGLSEKELGISEAILRPQRDIAVPSLKYIMMDPTHLITSCLMVICAPSHLSKEVMNLISTGIIELMTDTTAGTKDAPMVEAKLVK